MAISQALGVAVLIARRFFDVNSAIRAMTNGINATNPLIPCRESRRNREICSVPNENGDRKPRREEGGHDERADGFGFRRKRRSLRYDRGDTSMRCDHENRQGKDNEGGGVVKAGRQRK